MYDITFRLYKKAFKVGSIPYTAQSAVSSGRRFSIGKVIFFNALPAKKKFVAPARNSFYRKPSFEEYVAEFFTKKGQKISLKKKVANTHFIFSECLLT